MPANWHTALVTGLVGRPVDRNAATRPAAQTLVALTSFQLGAVLAKYLIGTVGIAGVVFLRLIFGAVFLNLYWRTGWRWPRRIVASALLVGTLLAVHHFCFYYAISSIPIGVAITIEFSGPLCIALATAGRRLDWLWALMAAGGVCAVALGGANGSGHYTVLAVAAAAGAGITWAAYILVSRKLQQNTDDGRWLALACAWAAIICAPYGIATAGLALVTVHALVVGAVVALLCEVVPYSLINHVLKSMRPGLFSVLASSEPAIGAFLGLTLLDQKLSLVQWVGIPVVTIASIGHVLSTNASGVSPPTDDDVIPPATPP